MIVIIKEEDMPSSVIASMQYDSTSSTLRVIYVSGNVYDYESVPASIYNAMKTSGSKGTYLNKYIKGNYPFKKVK
ncbi:MAG: KTSC domain-containing protein [Ferruginibacter sp.]